MRLAIALVAATGTSLASGQITYISQSRSVDATYRGSDLPGDVPAHQITIAPGFGPFVESASASGLAGSCSASQNSTLSPDSITASLNAFAGGAQGYSMDGLSTLDITFSLSQPSEFFASGHITGLIPLLRGRLSSGASTIFDFTGFAPLNISGTLGTGTYRLELEAFARNVPGPDFPCGAEFRLLVPGPGGGGLTAIAGAWALRRRRPNAATPR